MSRPAAMGKNWPPNTAGRPHVVPFMFRYYAELGTIDIASRLRQAPELATGIYTDAGEIALSGKPIHPVPRGR